MDSKVLCGRQRTNISAEKLICYARTWYLQNWLILWVHLVVKLCPRVTIMSFSEAWGRYQDNNVSVETQSSMYLKRNMKLILFSISPCEIDGQRWHGGLQGTKQIEGQEDFIISHPANVEDVIFFSFLSDYLIWLLVIRICFPPSRTWIVSVNMFVCGCAIMCDDFRITSKWRLPFVTIIIKARSTDMRYIIYISVTTMHFQNLDFWQMEFLFWNVFHFSHSVSKIDAPPPSDFWLLLIKFWLLSWRNKYTSTIWQDNDKALNCKK